MKCPVCRQDSTEQWLTVDTRPYWRCSDCQARFLDPDHLPDRRIEKAEYDQHQNDPGDPGYRQFLQQLLTPLLERIGPGSRGLDYGCGPGPALAYMLEEAGHTMSLFDPIYAPDPGVLDTTYDFVTCTEVVEHFHDPATEFRQLDRLLKPGGWLGVMTRFQTDDDRFAGWHYRRDPTHVVFYRPETFEWLGRHLGWEAECLPPQVVMARKKVKGER
ncbi:class I SAM-dependent methyltransferase [Wenzhouxiangella sp. AB-CW3]|uniref:class I SAM-dependent methyltransferase n=1 Tax=Wenzhouxiangella sp. AB-CW3 TaxID=2771012 RepID=UPI001CC29A9A|nr:class I SAM-dependent methyltransferase [Wenzhouxiangella sp. AB-CW3]